MATRSRQGELEVRLLSIKFMLTILGLVVACFIGLWALRKLVDWVFPDQ